MGEIGLVSLLPRYPGAPNRVVVNFSLFLRKLLKGKRTICKTMNWYTKKWISATVLSNGLATVVVSSQVKGDDNVSKSITYILDNFEVGVSFDWSPQKVTEITRHSIDSYDKTWRLGLCGWYCSTITCRVKQNLANVAKTTGILDQYQQNQNPTYTCHTNISHHRWRQCH